MTLEEEEEENKGKVSISRPIKGQYYCWNPDKQNYNHFFPEFQPVGGVCFGKKENRTAHSKFTLSARKVI